MLIFFKTVITYTEVKTGPHFQFLSVIMVMEYLFSHVGGEVSCNHLCIQMVEWNLKSVVKGRN